MSGVRSFGVAVIGGAHVHNPIVIVENGMKFEYLLHTMALVVPQKEVDIASKATKSML